MVHPRAKDFALSKSFAGERNSRTFGISHVDANFGTIAQLAAMTTMFHPE